MYDYPKSVRLRTTHDFRRTLDQGRKTVCPKVVLYGRMRPSDERDASGLSPAGLRFGLIVSKKVGNAVTRNRVKRGLREGFRHLRADLSIAANHAPHLDLVIIARPTAATASAAELQAAVRQCIERHLRQRDDA